MTASIRVRAPATTANLGPGFDCAGIALDLWNELEVTEGQGVELVGEGADELDGGAGHLGLRAYALLAPVEGRRFVFRNRIPLARGLGSSAATIALGLVAASLGLGRRPEVDELLELGIPLEGHADNLAAALAGGVCLTWESKPGDRRMARVAQDLPLALIAVIPESRVETAAARAALPAEVSHIDAAFSAGRAALLGAGLASGAPDLLSEAFADRLHEPYRAPNAPLLEAIRTKLPSAAAGVTLSGSGPTVIVWAREEEAAACETELVERFPAERVLRLAVSPLGAGPVE